MASCGRYAEVSPKIKKIWRSRIKRHAGNTPNGGQWKLIGKKAKKK